jgi:hypothetical protein
MYRTVAVQPALQDEVGEDEREDEREDEQDPKEKRRRRGGSETWWRTEAPSRDHSVDIRSTSGGGS